MEGSRVRRHTFAMALLAVALCLSGWSCDGGKYDAYWNRSTWSGWYEVDQATGEYASLSGAHVECDADIHIPYTYKGGTVGVLVLPGVDSELPERAAIEVVAQREEEYEGEGVPEAFVVLDGGFSTSAVAISGGSLGGEELAAADFELLPEGKTGRADTLVGEGTLQNEKGSVTIRLELVRTPEEE